MVVFVSIQIKMCVDLSSLQLLEVTGRVTFKHNPSHIKHIPAKSLAGLCLMYVYFI